MLWVGTLKCKPLDQLRARDGEREGDRGRSREREEHARKDSRRTQVRAGRGGGRVASKTQTRKPLATHPGGDTLLARENETQDDSPRAPERAGFIEG